MSQDRTVAILSPGEMGSRLGAALRDGGVRVVTCLEDRGAATAERAAGAGMQPLPSLEETVRQAELVVSVVPPAAAEPLAERVAAAQRRVGSGPLYVDGNAIGPATARRIEQTLAAAGGRFVDGSIIGTADNVPRRTTLYLSGPDAEAAAALLAPLRTAVIGAEPGQASAFKVLYAGLTKGMTALGLELLAGAERLGLRESLMEKYQADHPSVARFLERTLPGLAPRATRRAQEMEELAETLEQIGLSAAMAHSAQQVLEAVGARCRESGPPESEEVAALLVWWLQALESRDLTEGAGSALRRRPFHG